MKSIPDVLKLIKISNTLNSQPKQTGKLLGNTGTVLWCLIYAFLAKTDLAW